MEATQASMSSGCSNHAVSINRTTAPRYESYRGLMGAYPETKCMGSPSNSNSRFKETVKLPASVYHPQTLAPTSAEGVSNCYVFKSRLQEYAQKVELPTPTYETIKEGPSHAPFFRSTVIVGGARYDSLPGFYNRKAAEQSAAEVALMDLSASGDKKESISVPVHETGLCKNVLQEYAQKMNYAIPTYTCKKEGTGRSNLFSCTVDIGGIQYIGTAATSKKEAEIKAARTALLAIHSSRSDQGEPGGKINYTVVPLKRKAPEPSPPQDETSKPKKSKKPRYRHKRPKKTQPDFSDDQIQAGNMAICLDSSMGFPNGDQTVQVAGDGQSGHCLESSAQANGDTNVGAHIEGPSEGEGDGGSDVQVSTNGSQLTVSVKNSDTPPTGDQNVQMADDEQSGHCLESSAQVNEATNMVDPMVHIGEPSEGEGAGGLDVQVNVNASQLTISQQEGDMSAGSGDTDLVPLTDANSNNGPTSMIPMEASTVEFMDYEKVRNDDHGIDNIIPLINTQAYQEVVPVISDSRTEPSDSGDGPTDVKALSPVAGPVQHVVEANTGISDAVRLDSRTEPGDSGDGRTAAEAVSPIAVPADHVAALNASPLREESNTGTSDAIRPDLPYVGLVDHVVATNASPPRVEINTGTSDAARPDSRSDPTDAKPLSPGVGPVDHVVTANASSLKEESNTGTSETKVNEFSAVDVVISCSDQTVNVADSNA